MTGSEEAYAACRVAHDKTLRDAMVAINVGGLEIALVVAEDERLVAVMTDGDIRRALLAGVALEAPLLPYATRTFVAVRERATRSEIIEQMEARRLGQVPIVDESGRLVGLHTVHGVIGTRTRANWAVVMAGGLGTRLRPLTEDVPKPMLRVAGRPILERIVLHLVSRGLRTIFLAVNYRKELIEQHFGNGEKFGCTIEYLREESPLGTGGALSLLPAPPTAPVLVMNGDLVTQAAVDVMFDQHAADAAARPRVVATIGARRYTHRVPFGCLESVDGDVKHMREKPSLHVLVNAGIYILEPRLLARIERGAALQLPDLLHAALASGDVVRTHEITEDWLDVGQRETLDEANGVDLLRS